MSGNVPLFASINVETENTPLSSLKGEISIPPLRRVRVVQKSILVTKISYLNGYFQSNDRS